MVIASLYPCPFDMQFRHDFSASIYKNGKIFAYEENKINKFLKKRKKIYAQYYKSLNFFKNVIKFNQIDKNFPSYHLCIINIDFGKLKTNKDNFIRTLAKNNIFCQYHYIPLYNFSFYKKKINKKNFEGSEKYFKNSVSLPIFYDLKNLEIKKIINLTKKFISKKI